MRKLKNKMVKDGFKRILVLLLCILTIIPFTACTRKLGEYTINNKTVMKVGNIKVSYDDYKMFYYIGMVKLGGKETDWTKQENLDKLKNEVERVIRTMCAKKTYIKEYGISMTKKDNQLMDDMILGYMEEQGGETGYNLWLADNRTGGKTFREQLEINYFLDPYLREILYTGIDNIIKMDDETVKKDINDNFYRYTQIFISFKPGDNYSDNRKKIDEAMDKLNRGFDFVDVAKEYSNWTVDASKGVYTTKGEKIPEIENAALKLKEGEVSKVIQSSEGHHIIKRLPLEDSYIDENLEELGYISATRRYNDYMIEYGKGLTVEYTKFYETLTFDQLTQIEEK